jgi:hypothetical protein
MKKFKKFMKKTITMNLKIKFRKSKKQPKDKLF